MASASCDSPRRSRHDRSFEANDWELVTSTSEVVAANHTLVRMPRTLLRYTPKSSEPMKTTMNVDRTRDYAMRAIAVVLATLCTVGIFGVVTSLFESYCGLTMRPLVAARPASVERADLAARAGSRGEMIANEVRVSQRPAAARYRRWKPARSAVAAD